MMYQCDDGNDNDIKYLAGNKGRRIYTVSLLFCLIYSSIIYVLQFLNETVLYVYIYLTNWTFTLFMVSIILTTGELFIISLSKIMISIIFHINIITRPVYLYVCLVYTISLALTLIGFGDLLSYEHIINIKYDFLFYFNDISKHFVFVALLIILFIFSPREKNPPLLLRWWKFLYSVAFVYTYMLFTLIYYIATDGVKIYNIDNLAISILAILTAPTLFFIYTSIKVLDTIIRDRLFTD